MTPASRSLLFDFLFYRSDVSGRGKAGRALSGAATTVGVESSTHVLSSFFGLRPALRKVFVPVTLLRVAGSRPEHSVPHRPGIHPTAVRPRGRRSHGARSLGAVGP